MYFTVSADCGHFLCPLVQEVAGHSSYYWSPGLQLSVSASSLLAT
jgi:hypothetical protein